MDDLVRRRKDNEAYKWLFTEVLIKQFNNILTKEWYQYYIVRYLKHKDPVARKKIKDHTEAIHWFLHERNCLCFRILEIEWISDEKVLEAITKKFNGNKKFIKILKDFTERLEEDDTKKRKK